MNKSAYTIKVRMKKNPPADLGPLAQSVTGFDHSYGPGEWTGFEVTK